LVREPLHERRLLLETIAPHPVKATPFLFPPKRPVWDRFVMGSGLFVHDARFSVMLARTATAHGAFCASAVDVVAFLDRGGRIAGIRARDLESGDELDDAGSDSARSSVRDLRLSTV
jgi:glycerol-3-phosphate dehydrogenase